MNKVPQDQMQHGDEQTQNLKPLGPLNLVALFYLMMAQVEDRNQDMGPAKTSLIKRYFKGTGWRILVQTQAETPEKTTKLA